MAYSDLLKCRVLYVLLICGWRDSILEFLDTEKVYISKVLVNGRVGGRCMQSVLV